MAHLYTSSSAPRHIYLINIKFICFDTTSVFVFFQPEKAWSQWWRPITFLPFFLNLEVSPFDTKREKKNQNHMHPPSEKKTVAEKKKIWGHFITALGEIGKAKHLSGLGPITLTSCSVWLLFWNILNQACFSCVHLSNLWAQGLNFRNDHTGVEELVNVSPPWGTRIPGSLGARWMPGSQRL